MRHDTPSTTRWWRTTSRRPGAPSPKSKCSGSSERPVLDVEPRLERSARRSRWPLARSSGGTCSQVDALQGRESPARARRTAPSRSLWRNRSRNASWCATTAAKRLLQPFEVEIAGRLEEERLVPMVWLGEALLEEPALDRGERDRPRARALVGRRREAPAAGTAGQRGAAMVGCLERSRGADRNPACRARDDHLDRQDRVAAQLEEVVVDAHPRRRRARSAQIPADARLRVAAPRRRVRPRPARSARGGAGSALRSTLPFCGERQRRQADEGRRDHVLGQRLRSGLRSSPVEQRPLPPSADHVGDQALVARRVLARDDHAPRARRGAAPAPASISPSSMRKPRIFTWWSIRPRYSRSPSARRRARSPRAVEPRARLAREADRATKRSRGQLGPARGSRARRPRRRRTSRPATPTGTGSPCAVEHVHAAGPGSARRSTLPGPASRSARRERPVGHVHGRLGDPVHVDQPRALVAVALEPGRAGSASSSASPPKIT